MTKTNKIIIYSLIGASVVGLSTFLLLRARKKRGKTKFRRKAVSLAKKEWEDWNKGKTKEKSGSMYQRLKTYWQNIGWDESRWTPSGVAWSSAFISYIMKKANAKDDFKYSASHSVYIRDAVKNRKNNNKNPFKAYRLNEKKAEIGDLVCYARQGGVSYDTTSAYQSHCDIIVDINKDSVDVIGGNISDSVTKKSVPLTKDGYIKEGGKRFTIIKTK